MNYSLKQATKDDQDFLFEMLYQSIYHEPGTPKPDRKIIEEPSLSKYVEGWGRKGDFSLIALDEGSASIGAVWLRYFYLKNRGYGYIADDIPELGVAVFPEYRGKGVGSFLIKEVMERTKDTIQSISLSVQPENRAMDLYKRLGFYQSGIFDDSVVMRFDH